MNNNKKIRIAIDAMGGDYSPANEVEGAVLALKNLGNKIVIVLVGDKAKIDAELSGYEFNKDSIEVLHTDQIVTMHDDPTAVLKTKRNSSMAVSLSLHAKNEADAVISAGNTGAFLAASTVILGRIKGASRPTLGTYLPTSTDKKVFILDVGANIDPKPQFLYEFAVMASIYCEQTSDINNPSIGLMNVGEESSKGTEVVQETHKLLKNSELNFFGNVEGRDIFSGKVDIVVFDGFLGNILLKFAESLAPFVKGMMGKLAGSKFSVEEVKLAGSVMKEVFSGLDPQAAGGLPFLGLNGISLVAHGGSTPMAFSNLIHKAIDLIETDINTKIETALNKG
ncbi:MAG: phosphate acyltransferase PlsX [Candidatus Kapabacteria bacterium]|jgi:glycerol-3-phosphate acyltransferase PlsX|nr:phosphate acyltransferase PlsX [Candidatus Kapabacteria bacterium]